MLPAVCQGAGVTTLPPFRLEEYFARWEFAARFHLTASDAQTMAMADLLALADDTDRAAWESLTLGYTETKGGPALRAAVAETYAGVAPEDVLCFAGAQEAITLAMQVLLGPDDHAVVVTPNYTSAETIPLSLCEVTGVALDPDDDWRLDLDAVRAALRSTTRVVSVNFPNNPTGKVVPHKDFQELVALCDERGIRLFSDEVYRGLERDDARRLPQAAEVSPTALSLNVMSKAYGLPGLRIGWLACRDRELLARIERQKDYSTICNAAPSELLARIALRARDVVLGRTRSVVAQNIPLFDAFFAAHGELFDWQAPDGGCVAFPRWLGEASTGLDAETMCRRLVEEAGVLLLPPSVYASALTPTPTDRFRIGVGRANPEPALAAFADWLARL